MQNEALQTWIESVAAHTRPERIRICDGSDAEFADLTQRMLKDRTLIALRADRNPRSFLHRSHPSDVARTEHLTFVSTPERDDAGPTNNWMSPSEAQERVWPLFAGCMQQRTMFVVPYLMGPADSPYSRVGVQLTDSPYVVASLRTMTRMGDVALQRLSRSDGFVRGVHSLGDLSPDRRFVVHFPETTTIWSIGTGYGGNALLSKKCHALRIASVQARNEGWLAEHMLILGITSPSGTKHYVAAAFPSACGKTNLAMLIPSLAGYTIETVGDDICWMHVGEDGRLWAINPEAGMFGVAPGTSLKTNPNAMKALTHDTIFTNVALRSDGSPWWEGMSALGAGEVLVDWRGRSWRSDCDAPAAHPNARFTVALRQCPSVGASFEDPRGVPISALLFGGRRAKLAPLVYEARSFDHGVYVGATMVSETTAAATGAVGVPRNDPMAMLPFCGYNMGDYFAHWLAIGKRLKAPPKIFHVNWFRSDDNGRFLWPGFGENVRVLDWIVRRVEGRAEAEETPIGAVPTARGLALGGLDMPAERLSQLLSIDRKAWLQEAERNAAFLSRFGQRLPVAISDQHKELLGRLARGLN